MGGAAVGGLGGNVYVLELLEKLPPDKEFEDDVPMHSANQANVASLPFGEGIADVPHVGSMAAQGLLGSQVCLVVALLVLQANSALSHHLVGGMAFDLRDPNGINRLTFGGNVV